jgi:hypothetical protein
METLYQAEISFTISAKSGDGFYWLVGDSAGFRAEGRADSFNRLYCN